MKFPINEFIANGAIISPNPGEWVLAWGASEWSSARSPQGVSFFLPDYFLRAVKPWLCFANFQQLTTFELAELLDQSSAQTPSWQWNEPEAEEFAQDFRELQHMMELNQLKKAVPVNFARASGRVQGNHLLHLLRQALLAPASLRAYGFWTNESGIFGLTPEILFSQRDPEHLHTMAIAGTRPYPSGDRLPLLEDAKECEEHRLVVHDLVERLSRWGEIRMSATEVLQLPKLEHLKTCLDVEMTNPTSFEEIVYELHPTPAVGAVPRETGLKWLSKLESRGTRGRFGAPFGVVLPGERTCCLVAIRNIQWQDDEIQLGSGCGILPQSQFEREWLELSSKRAGVRLLLDI